MYYSSNCCSDLGVDGWVIGNPNIVRIFKIRTEKWTVPKCCRVFPVMRLVNLFVLIVVSGDPHHMSNMLGNFPALSWPWIAFIV